MLGNSKKESLGTWIIGLLGIIATVWGAILIIGFSMRAEISEHYGTLTALSQRVDRIADAISDIKIKIAREAIEKPFKTLVLAGKPYTVGDKIFTPLNIINTDTGEEAIYVVSQKDIADTQAMWALAGIVRNIDSAANSFKDMEKYSMDFPNPKFAPNGVEKDWSFVSYKDPSALEGALQKTGYKKAGTGKIAPDLSP